MASPPLPTPKIRAEDATTDDLERWLDGEGKEAFRGSIRGVKTAVQQLVSVRNLDEPRTLTWFKGNIERLVNRLQTRSEGRVNDATAKTYESRARVAARRFYRILAEREPLWGDLASYKETLAKLTDAVGRHSHFDSVNPNAFQQFFRAFPMAPQVPPVETVELPVLNSLEDELVEAYRFIGRWKRLRRHLIPALVEAERQARYEQLELPTTPQGRDDK